MNEIRTASFSWNCIADFELDDRLSRHLQHEVRSLCRLCAASGKGKHHLLVGLRRDPDSGRCRVALTLRHSGFVFAASDQDVDAVAAFEAASEKLEQAVKRLHRFQGERKTQAQTVLPEPVERADRSAPRDASDVLKELAADYLKRLRRYARRRLRTESILHPDWPVAAISDGDVVDEAIVRIARLAPEALPFGAFWPKAMECCEDALRKELEEVKQSATSMVSLETELPDDLDWDSGYEPERPYEIIDRILYPPEEELEDATPDQRAAAPSTIAEYEDFVAYLHQQTKDWPERERRIIDLYCFEGFTAREIASYEGADESEILPVIKRRLRELQEITLKAD